MNTLKTTAIVATLLAGLSAPCRAQTAYPMLMSIEPVAAQLGTSSDHLVRSRYSMAGAYTVLVSGTGVRGEVVPVVLSDEEKAKPKSNESLRIRLHVDPDAIAGVRDLRLATPTGVSTVGQLVVVADPVIEESTAADPANEIQRIPIPTTVCGRIEKAEDVDVYRFDAAEGDELSFNVLCMRLQDRIHDLQLHADPILTLKNSAGATVASSDNEFRGDPYIRHKFEKAGEYLIELRDVRYQGNAFWTYSFEVNRRPLVSGVFPVGFARGSRTRLELIGYGVGRDQSFEIGLPNDIPTGLRTWPVAFHGSNRQPQSIVVADSGTLIESSGEHDSLSTAQSISIPVGMNGRIDSPGDIDLYAFDAKKGERLNIEVVASRVRSALDSHLRILAPDGSPLQTSDDVRIGKRNISDSIIEGWTVPNDGRYFVEIRDLHLRGGSSFIYFLNLTPSAPSFALFTDTDKTLISPGTSGVLFVRAERKNGADGAVQLHVDGLPSGVTASCGKILAGKGQDGCIVFQAAEGTSPVAGNIQIRGTMTLTANDAGDGKQLSADAVVYQEIYQPGGGRGHWPVENHALAVCAPGDIRRVTLSADEITLTPGSSQRIDVELERAPGFDKNVLLEAAYMHLNNIFGNSLPDGVTVDAANSNTLLTGGAFKGHILLKAAESASEVDKQQSIVMANVSLNFVMKATYASQPLLVTVKK